MAGVNKVIIVGRLGQDPELKTISQGTNVATFNVATSESWTDKNNQRQEKTEWHRIVVWNKLADLCSKYLSKGKQVYIEGRLQTRSWEDPQGQKRYTTEIVGQTVQFLGGNEKTQGNQSSFGGMGSSSNQDQHDFGPEPDFNQSEEIPF